MFVGVEASAHEQQIRIEFGKQRREHVVDGGEVGVVVAAGRERHVRGRPLAVALTCFADLAGPWVEPPFVNRAVEHVVAVVEDVLDAVAVVDVPVDDGDAVGGSIECRLGGDGGVVEEAKPHRVVGDRVVAGRPTDGERRLPSLGAIEGFVRAPDGLSGALERRLPGCLDGHRVGVPLAAAVGAELANLLYVFVVVDRAGLCLPDRVGFDVLDAVTA